MFIITKEKSSRRKDVVGIFDLDNSTVSGVTKNFLNSSEKSGSIIHTDSRVLPKSFILISEINKTDKINKKNKYNKYNKKNKKEEIYFSSHVTGYILNLNK